MRDWFNVVRQVYPPAVSGLEFKKISYGAIPELVGHTSGDSSERIMAPLVSTWITFAEGSDGAGIFCSSKSCRVAGSDC